MDIAYDSSKEWDSHPIHKSQTKKCIDVPNKNKILFICIKYK